MNRTEEIKDIEERISQIDSEIEELNFIKDILILDKEELLEDEEIRNELKIKSEEEADDAYYKMFAEVEGE